MKSVALRIFEKKKIISFCLDYATMRAISSLCFNYYLKVKNFCGSFPQNNAILV